MYYAIIFKGMQKSFDHLDRLDVLQSRLESTDDKSD